MPNRGKVLAHSRNDQTMARVFAIKVQGNLSNSLFRCKNKIGTGKLSWYRNVVKITGGTRSVSERSGDQSARAYH